MNPPVLLAQAVSGRSHIKILTVTALFNESPQVGVNLVYIATLTLHKANMSRFLSIAQFLIVIFLVGCGGGGQNTTAANNSEPPIATVNELVPLAGYSGATRTFQKINLTMPASGVLDFSLIGVRAQYCSFNRHLHSSG